MSQHRTTGMQRLLHSERLRAGALVVVSITLCVAAIEAGFRLAIPFIELHWPGRFLPEVGWVFEPGAKLRWTNRVDYWTTTRVNALGFLDREPSPALEPGTCRIAFIGDSFVEAVQVPIEAKAHVQLEQLAADAGGPVIHTAAFGYSGTGQANQLAFYDRYARALAPDVVVLVAVSNDFANNSPVLESVRHGWHPYHPPRFFFAYERETGAVRPLPIDPNWAAHTLRTAESVPSPIHLVHTALVAKSYAYSWVYTHLQFQYPGLDRTFLATGPEDLQLQRIQAIESLENMAGTFAGWKFPDDLGIDEMFHALEMPSVFDAAIVETAAAFRAFQERATADGFHLVVLSAYEFAEPRLDPSALPGGRTLLEGGALARLEAILAALGIPLLDQAEFIARTQRDVAQAHFHRDRHWSAAGHRFAAELLHDYLRSHPELCSPDRRAGVAPDYQIETRSPGGR